MKNYVIEDGIYYQSKRIRYLEHEPTSYKMQCLVIYKD